MKILIAFGNSGTVNNEILISALAMAFFLVYVGMSVSKEFISAVRKKKYETGVLRKRSEWVREKTV